MLCISSVLLACWVLGGFVHVKRFKIGRYDRNGFNNPVHLPTHWYGSNMVIVIEVWSVQKETNMQNIMKYASCKWNVAMLFINVLCKRMGYRTSCDSQMTQNKNSQMTKLHGADYRSSTAMHQKHNISTLSRNSLHNRWEISFTHWSILTSWSSELVLTLLS